MSDYIPISRVFITYKPSSAEISTPTYSGVIIGEMRDLHYVTNSANDLGTFTIENEDTRVVGKQFNVTANDGASTPASIPVTIELSEYPGLRSGFEVDYDPTVALHSVDTNLMAMYRDSVTKPTDLGGTAGTKIPALVPLSPNSFVIYEGSTFSEPLTTFNSTEYGVNYETPAALPEKLTITSNSTMRTGKVIPGSYMFLFTTDTSGTPVPHLISDRDPSTGLVGMMQELKVYTHDGTDWVVSTTITLTNSYVNDYKTNPGFKVVVTLPTGSDVNSTAIAISAFVMDEGRILKPSSNLRVVAGIKPGDVVSLNAGGNYLAIDSAVTSLALTKSTADLAGIDIDIYIATLYTNLMNMDSGDVLTERTDVATIPMVNATVKSVDNSTGIITMTPNSVFAVSDVNNGMVAAHQYSIVYLEATEDNRVISHQAIPESGVDEGKVVTILTSDSITSGVIVRGYKQGLSLPLWDTEPTANDYHSQKDGIVLSGDVHLAYEAENKDERQYHNVLYVTRENYLDIVGKPDPRNPIGFAYDRSYAISQTDMYALITKTTDTELLDALGILSNYENILHVYLIADGYSPIFDTWVENECKPDNSRFRFGFNPTEIIEYKTLMENEAVVATLEAASVGDPYKLTISSSANPLNLSNILEPGAAVVFEGDTTVYTVGDSSTILPNSVVFIETYNGTPPSFSTPISEIDSATLKLATQELVDNMVSAMVQSSDNNYFMKIISGTIDYSYEDVETGETKHTELPVEYNGILAYGVALGTYPQQPLTYIVVDGYGFGRVNGTTGRFSRDQFTQLVAAGYYTLTSTLGAKPEPYCLRDVTCGIARGTSLNGTFSKLRPVIIYAKDIYYVTKQFLGRYNVVDDVILNIQLRLEALRKRYTTKPIRFLGTRLAKATPAKLTKIPNGLRIDYAVSPQDPLITINNYITVTDNTKEA